MSILKKQIGHFPIGIWLGIIAVLCTFLAWLMQEYSLLDWEGAIKLGVQSESFSGNAVDRALANIERSIALADMVWPLPIAIVAIVGLFKKKFYGLVAAMMDFAICVYFPLFFMFQRYSTDLDTAISAICLFAIPSLLGIIGLWVNREEFTKN